MGPSRWNLQAACMSTHLCKPLIQFHSRILDLPHFAAPVKKNVSLCLLVSLQGYPGIIKIIGNKVTSLLRRRIIIKSNMYSRIQSTFQLTHSHATPSTLVAPLEPLLKLHYQWDLLMNLHAREKRLV